MPFVKRVKKKKKEPAAMEIARIHMLLDAVDIPREHPDINVAYNAYGRLSILIKQQGLLDDDEKNDSEQE